MGEANSPAMWSLPDLSEPATNSCNSGIKMAHKERLKLRTLGFTNIEATIYSLVVVIIIIIILLLYLFIMSDVLSTVGIM
jgi:cell division protein FtsL